MRNRIRGFLIAPSRKRSGMEIKMDGDTIAAISTALSESGIGIVRISGKDAVETADRIFRTKSGKRILKTVASHTIHYGLILDKDNGGVIDEAMVSVMRAPKSYTAEDVVEINCHGGVLVMRKILEAVLKCGARMAEPGEFTKRAFLNGRIDLAEAEAVMDVIRSKSDMALSASMGQLNGSLSNAVRDIRKSILYEIAFIESALDDPEHVSLEGYPERLKNNLEDFISRIEKLIDSSDRGKLIRDGINTVIVGKPNVGKSSLLNLLLGEERAIVTEVAGTTRDVLQESIRIHGIGLNVTDTAGIRDTQDRVEKIGVERAKQYAAQADLILYVVDSSVPLDENDDAILSMIGTKKTLILLNKSDLESVVAEKDILLKIKDADITENSRMYSAQNFRIIKTSARENYGIDALEDAVREMFFEGSFEANSEVTVTNMRHREALKETLESLRQVRQSVENGMPEDFYSIDLMSACASLGKITGEEAGEDLINEIFSKFCMGK